MSFINAIFSRTDIGDRPAFCFPDSQSNATSFRALDQISKDVARRLAALGVLPNQIVALDFSNEYLHAIFLVACARAGVATMSGALADQAGGGVKAIFTDRQRDASGSVPAHVVDQEWTEVLHSTTPSRYDLPIIHGDQLCRVMLTSGTTGRPKASYLTYDMVQERLDSYVPAFGEDFGSGASVMCGMQLSSSLGFGFFFNALTRGGTYCADSKSFDRLSAVIAEFGVNALVVSPATLAEIVNFCEAHGRASRLVKGIYTAGSHIGPELESRARGILCDRLIVFYGTTETGVVSVRKSAGSLGDVGTVVPTKSVEILDEQGSARPQGQVGSIRIRNVDGHASFYDRNAWAAGLASDHFVPGDNGMIDGQNHLIILGRQDGLINAGGVKTSPELLEQIISSAPGVRDCGVITQRDDMGIDRIVAFLVLRPEWSEKAFLTHCREKISHHFLPAKFVVVKTIARNSNGKVDRQALANQVP